MLLCLAHDIWKKQLSSDKVTRHQDEDLSEMAGFRFLRLPEARLYEQLTHAVITYRPEV